MIIDRPKALHDEELDLGRTKAVFLQHPTVQAVELQMLKNASGMERLMAEVVLRPDKQGLLDDADLLALQDTQVSRWQTLFDHAYRKPVDSPDPTFNATTWQSSYSGQTFAAAQLQQVVDDTVAQILRLNPKHLLEIGCGTGLLLFRLANHCDHFWGTDLSDVVINNLQQRLTEQASLSGKVTLAQRSADDFSGLTPHMFDTVVLNSVIQYFPSADYLAKVLQNLVRYVKPGGAIYLGDVRSRPLLTAFHASVQLHLAAENIEAETLQQRIQTQLDRENELVIDPAFFVALKQHVPGISHVEIVPKFNQHPPGDSTSSPILNELTKFRYQVIIHVSDGADNTALPEIKWVNWQAEAMTLAKFRQMISDAQPDHLGLTCVPNARLADERALLKLLTSPKQPHTVGALRSAIQQEVGQGIEPLDWWAVPELAPYHITVSWAQPDAYGCYDLVLQRQKDSGSHASSTAHALIAERMLPLDPWHQYTTNPLQDRVQSKRINVLRQFLKSHLPQAQIPAVIRIVESIL